MLVISLRDVDKTFGERHVLRGVSLDVARGERIGLVGPNGSGKSTLLRIAAGTEHADAGTLRRRREVRIGHLEQEPVLEAELTIRTAVRAGLRERDAVLAELDVVHRALAGGGETRHLLRRQADLEDRLALLGGHDVEHRVESMIRHVGLADPDALCGTLSGGERRRAALARLLLRAPDLMLLDEPTNHLDALVVEWLEDFLLATPAAVVLVTHDRYVLDRVADRIVEIDRGELHVYEGGYRAFLEQRAARLDAERKTERTRLNLLRRETAWIRRGPPGRSTKAKARIRRYEQLIEAPETVAAEPEFTIPPGPRLGKKVVRLHGVSQWSVLKGLDLEIGCGERVGIVGPNGAGKTTLLRICLGELQPERGRVETGATVRFAYMDQLRSGLQAGRSVVAEVGDGSAWVKVGDRDVRVESFLESFLFPRAMLQTPVGELSGGERNRVLLAKLLLQGGNVLALDEPTNDLDLMTLRVLEEALAAFPGTVLVVSHDRWFLDRVATRIVYLDGKGGVRLHPGDVSSLIERMRLDAAPARKPKAAARGRPKAPRRLGYREQQELQALPDEIAAAEEELARLDAVLADPDFYGQPESRIKETAARRAEVAARVETLYARWEELEGD